MAGQRWTVQKATTHFCVSRSHVFFSFSDQNDTNGVKSETVYGLVRPGQAMLDHARPKLNFCFDINGKVLTNVMCHPVLRSGHWADADILTTRLGCSLEKRFCKLFSERDFHSSTVAVLLPRKARRTLR